jgi:hypothetical protein
MLDTLFQAVLIERIGTTAKWRRNMCERWPDDSRNERAANRLDDLAAASIDDVTPETWLAIEPHGKPKLRQVVCEVAKQVGFSKSPETIEEFFRDVVAKLARGQS